MTMTPEKLEQHIKDVTNVKAALLSIAAAALGLEQSEGQERFNRVVALLSMAVEELRVIAETSLETSCKEFNADI